MMQLRPSSAHIWTKCSAQPRLAVGVPPEPESDPAREGTCAAWLAECVLTKQAPDCAAMIGAQHDNGWVVEPAMARHIQGYVDRVRSYGGTIDVERKVKLNDHIQGTPDSYGVLVDGTLRVDDLKYGFDPVEIWENPQVTIYAGAILRHLSARSVTIKRVTLGIYQPRSAHASGIHRTWSIWPEELMQQVRRIEAAALVALSDTAMAVPGEHCRYCVAAAKCTAVAHEVYRCVSRMHHAQGRHMNASEMAEELTFLTVAEAMMKARRDAVSAEAEARMDSGENIPGWHRESGYGQRRWKVPASMVKMLTGIDPLAGKMVTPAELERLGANPDVVTKLADTPRTKAKLRPVPQGFFAGKFGA